MVGQRFVGFFPGVIFSPYTQKFELFHPFHTQPRAFYLTPKNKLLWFFSFLSFSKGQFYSRSLVADR